MSIDWFPLVVALVAAFFLGAWFAERRTAKRREQASLEYERTRYSDENLAKAQLRFDERIARGLEIRLPDAVHGRKLHIYRHLMKGWFSHLDAQHRYDDTMSRRVRQDWVRYLDLLSRSETLRFLAVESEDDRKREKHDEDFRKMAAEIDTIENGFARAIGSEAVAALAAVREKSFDQFSYEGEIAPDGHYFRGWSPKGPEQPIPRTR